MASCHRSAIASAIGHTTNRRLDRNPPSGAWGAALQAMIGGAGCNLRLNLGVLRPHCVRLGLQMPDVLSSQVAVPYGSQAAAA